MTRLRNAIETAVVIASTLVVIGALLTFGFILGTATR